MVILSKENIFPKLLLTLNDFEVKKLNLNYYINKYNLKITSEYFINTKIDVSRMKDKKAIFTTRSDRNLSFLISCWKQIIKTSKDSILTINPPYNLTNEDKNYNIQS